MGVPKFYRWISERYPCLSEVVKEYQIPEFDNLYLDMNGVVHVCSHPEDDNPHFRITEEKIFSDIFHYIEVLFRMIKPRKVFFMAIDGVAPRAKMNQQRGRRFRSAREAENLVKKALEKGEILPTEARFDSNCITPGTEFMDKLHQQLQYFVVKKVSTDRMWQGVRIYLSGHETPGEGEHKVMDFIRYEKTQPGYDSNTRHCLYGLDADLIMLGLTTHEPHFSLLREEVRFGKNNQKRSNTPEETTFHLLHLSLMREYLDFEFSDLRPKLPFRYDLERIIDDWVLMGFLVGNDFIPHLPEFHIHHDALPQLWKTYKRVLPTLNGYLHDGGTLNLANFEKYLRVLSKFEVDKFGEKHADIKWLESRKREKNKPHALDSHQAGIPTANEFIQLKDDDCGYDNDFKFLQRDMEALALEYDFGDEEDDDEYFDEKVEHDDRFYQEFQKFKAEYYKEKMKYPVVNQDVLREQSHGYVRAIQWILFYYYNGVPSWSWYYPHHYAPYLSDVRDFAEMRMELDMATPFLPFQQLMAVLPAASKNLLPKPLQTLMISELSPVIDYYPIDFETDLNGKQQDWEAVVLIPFIDETRLISAMLPLEAKMTDEEKGRNKHGPHILFEYIAQPQGTYTSTVFPDLVNHQSRITEIPKYQFWIDPAKQIKGLQPGVKQDMYFPGFPTLKHIPHQSLLMKASVKVFQHNSRGENMVLTITRRGTGHDLEQVAHELIGQSVHVGWPHLIEARVNAVSDGETKYYGVISTSGKSKGHHNPSKVTIEHESLDSRAQGVWHKESESITEHYLGRKGVIVGDVQILVYVSPLAGRRYLCGLNGIVALEKQWSSNSMAFVYQGTVKDIAVKDPSYKEYKTLEELFYDKSEVFMLGHPHYGCMGEVLSVDPKNEGRIRVDFTILEEPDLTEVCQLRQKLSTQYYPGYNLARRLGIDSHLLSRITGCVFVTRGSRENNKGEERQNRINVGLNLKFNKSSTEVPGYTRKVETEWQYSPQLQIILEDYISTFPELFDHIGAFTNESSYFEADIFTPETEHTLQDLSKYLKQLPCAGIQPVPHGSDILDDQVVKGIQDEVKIIKERNRKKKKHIKMQVRPHLLYRPLEAQLTLVPDMSTTYCLFDRIVNVRDGFSVPLGIRGTIIGITNAEKEQDVVYDVVFDEEFMGGLTLRCSPNCGYRMPATAMINLSHGERKANGTVVAVTKPTAVVKPQSGAYSEAAARSRINNQPQRTHQQQNQRQNRYEQQPMQQRQQWSQQRQPQGHQQQEQQQHQQQQLHGVQGGRDQQRGNQQQQQQQQQQQMGFPGNKQQSQGSRQLYPNLQQFLQGNKNQRGSAHSQIQQQMQPQAPNEFADMWNQLQEGMVLNPEAGAVHIPQTYNLPPRMKNTQMRSDKMKSKESQPPQDDYKPSLEQAALALQASPVKQGPIVDHRTQQKSEPDLFDIKMEFVRDQPGGKKQNKSQKSKDSTYSVQSQPEIGGINEFAAIFQSLQDKDKAIKSQEFAPLDIQDSTAALCQMLNINQTEASNAPTSPGSQSAKEDSKPVYGKQLSVQQLFTEADHHQQQVLREQQQIREQGKTMNKPAMSSADVLAEFCLKSGLKKPVYDYQMGRENKQRGIVTLSNGQVFQGAFTRNLGHAADSAAAAALLHLNSNRGLGMPQVRPNQPPPQASSTSHQGAPPSQNTNRLSASPNSAFTPVRGPQQQSVSNPSSGPMAMSQPPPFPIWGPPPFPPPPQFGQFPTNQPPPQRFQHGNSPRGKGPRGGPMGFMPFHQGSGNYPRPHQGQLPIPGFNPNYPPPPPNQDGPPFAFHPQSMPQWERNKESWSQQQPPVKGQGVNQGQEVRAGQDKPQTNVETPKKANPFIPLQVMMKQKTPQRETSKKEDEIDSNISCPEAEKDRNVARVLDLNARPAESVNVGTPHSELRKNEQRVMTVNRVQNNDTSPVYQSAKTPPTSSISTQDKTSGSTPISASKQPHRPKSRIAANFGIKM